jgi:RNA polymerase sigma-70 factor (ECF subfamily)
MANLLNEANIHTVDLNPDDEIQVKKLIRAFKQGDQKAYNQIVRRYRKPVEALAFRMTRDQDEAADVAQEVFVKMARHIDRYDENRKFYTWLYRITVNASIDHVRRNRRHQHELLDSAPDIQEDPGSGPEMTYLRRRLKEHIDEATTVLNEKQRSAFVLRDIGGRKVDDVAGIMNMPEATVRWYLHRARARIRKELLRRCPHLLILLGIR